jgi:hypothetical protein
MFSWTAVHNNMRVADHRDSGCMAGNCLLAGVFLCFSTELASSGLEKVEKNR